MNFFDPLQMLTTRSNGWKCHKTFQLIYSYFIHIHLNSQITTNPFNMFVNDLLLIKSFITVVYFATD